MRRSAMRVPRAVLGFVVVFAGSVLAAAPASAGPTQTVEVDSFKELDEGKPLGTLVSSEGEVVPGLGHLQLKGVEATMIWSRVRGEDGATYFGTADRGRILRVRGESVRVVASLDTVLVTALAWSGENKLLAATMPEARIVEIEPQSGKWREIARLPAEHIWALVYDRRGKRIIAATGAPGKLFEVPARGGKPVEYFDPKEKHLLCLVQDPRGAFLTGGSDKAILYRVTGRQEGLAVHDFDANELRAVAVTRAGAIVAGVNKFPRRESGVPRFDRPKKDGEGTSFSAKKGNETANYKPQDLRPGAKQGTGALYRISPEGRIEELIALGEGYFTDLAVDAAGAIWAADGAQGKVYTVRGERAVSTLFDLPERQVLVLAVTGEERYVGTGDGGAIYRVLPRPAKAPAYESKVFDAKFPALWGALELKSGAKLALASRSGNTAKPDTTWSGWASARAVSGTRVQLASPVARYLQIRASWQAPGGALRGFKLYYRPQNQRARVTEISFERKRSDKESTNTKVKIEWKVENPDKDELVYRLYYREELGSSWRRIRTGNEPLTKTSYEWDTEGVADDTYRIRVVASDEAGNGAVTALKDSRVSPPLVVDNRRPDVTGLAVRFPWVSGVASDGTSPIRSVEYAIDGRSWRLVDPLDRIYDSSSEAFRILLPNRLPPGPHVIAIRVRDEAQNVGIRQLRFVR